METHMYKHHMINQKYFTGQLDYMKGLIYKFVHYNYESECNLLNFIVIVDYVLSRIFCELKYLISSKLT